LDERIQQLQPRQKQRDGWERWNSLDPKAEQATKGL
jgi:hypothetical protein